MQSVLENQALRRKNERLERDIAELKKCMHRFEINSRDEPIMWLLRISNATLARGIFSTWVNWHCRYEQNDLIHVSLDTPFDWSIIAISYKIGTRLVTFSFPGHLSMSLYPVAAQMLLHDMEALKEASGDSLHGVEEFLTKAREIVDAAQLVAQ